MNTLRRPILDHSESEPLLKKMKKILVFEGNSCFIKLHFFTHLAHCVSYESSMYVQSALLPSGSDVTNIK